MNKQSKWGIARAAVFNYATYLKHKETDQSFTVFPKGCLVWLQDDSMGYRPARVLDTFERGDAGQVEIIPENIVSDVQPDKSARLIRMNEQSLVPVDDMSLMKELNHPSILHNLRLRFSLDMIHTQVGNVLVSVNPYKELDAFSKEIRIKYCSGELSFIEHPHIYGIAERAFQEHTSRSNSNQSCIITGETGSGKTEATKYFVRYLLERQGTMSENGEQLQKKLSFCGEILEAFGNAKTERNDNSSRFGKWTEIYFDDDKKGTIIGATITPYLLEKSRVIHRRKGETNFHIFQYICAASCKDAAFAEEFKLTSAEQYKLLNRYDDLEFDVDSNFNQWQLIMKAIEYVGMSNQEFSSMIHVLSSLLKLGNVVFDSVDEGLTIKEEFGDYVNQAALHLGVTLENLLDALCNKRMTIRDESIVKEYTVDQASRVRNAIVKSLYCNIFHWLVYRSNEITACDGVATEQAIGIVGKDKFVGVLDIFGFESFDTNHFEQLCINYCNEKLQFYFNSLVFEAEQKECQEEEIDIQVPFISNEPCIKLFDGVTTSGLLGIINDETVLAHNDASVNPSESNGSPKNSHNSSGHLLGKIVQSLAGHTNFRKLPAKSSKSKTSFKIVHFAGELVYDVSDVIEKNGDVVEMGLLNLLSTSDDPIVQLLGMKDFSPSGGATGVADDVFSHKMTILMQLKRQFSSLMNRIADSRPHFVKCIKPNMVKKPNVFDSKMVLRQMRYSGLLELCRIRQVGFPVRFLLSEFCERYATILRKGGKMSEEDSSQIFESLQSMGVLKEGKFAVGKSKIFLRYLAYEDLETARDLVANSSAIRIQAMVRRYMSRLFYVCCLECKKRIVGASESFSTALTNGNQLEIQQSEVECLDALNAASTQLPFGGLSDENVKALRLKMQQHQSGGTIVVEKQVDEQPITSAGYQDPEASLMNLMTIGRSRKPSAEVFTKYEQVNPKLVEVQNQIYGAIQSRNMEQLAAAIRAAEENGLMNDPSVQVSEARALFDRLQREMDMNRELEIAASEATMKDLIRLQTAIENAKRIGMTPEHFASLAIAMGREAEIQDLRREEARKFEHMINARHADVIEELAIQLHGAPLERQLDEPWENAQQAAAAIDDVKAEIEGLACGLEEISRQKRTPENMELAHVISERLKVLNPRFQQQRLIKLEMDYAHLTEKYRELELLLHEKDLMLSQSISSSASHSQEDLMAKLQEAALWARKQVDSERARSQKSLLELQEKLGQEIKSRVEAIQTSNKRDLESKLEMQAKKHNIETAQLIETWSAKEKEAVENERLRMSKMRTENGELKRLVKSLQEEKDQAEKKLKSHKKQAKFFGEEPMQVETSSLPPPRERSGSISSSSTMSGIAKWGRRFSRGINKK